MGVGSLATRSRCLEKSQPQGEIPTSGIFGDMPFFLRTMSMSEQHDDSRPRMCLVHDVGENPQLLSFCDDTHPCSQKKTSAKTETLRILGGKRAKIDESMA